MSIRRTRITIGIASFVLAGFTSIVLLLVFPDLQPDVVGLILWAAFYTLFWRILLKTDHVDAATEPAPLEKVAAHSGTVEDIQADPDERSNPRKELQRARERDGQRTPTHRKKLRPRARKSAKKIRQRAREDAREKALDESRETELSPPEKARTRTSRRIYIGIGICAIWAALLIFFGLLIGLVELFFCGAVMGVALFLIIGMSIFSRWVNEQASPKFKCPSCGQSRVPELEHLRKELRRGEMVDADGWGLPTRKTTFVLYARTYECLRCGHSWTEDDR